MGGNFSLNKPPDAAYFLAATRRRQFAFWAAAVCVAVVTGASFATSPILPFALFGALAVFVVTWNVPKFGAYLLLFAACVLDSQKNVFPDQTTELVQFFRPLQEIVRGSGMVLSMAELYMLLVGGMSLARALLEKRFQYSPGRYCAGMLALLCWWFFEVLNGVATGGDVKLAFLEIRISMYIIGGYFIAYGVLRTKEEINTAGWLILIGSGIKGIQGCFRYYITFNHDISSFPSGRSILEHHEAFMFNVFFFYVLLLFLTNGPLLQKRIAIGLLPFVLLANLYNGRRSSDFATIIGLVVLVAIFYIRFPERRIKIQRGALIFLATFSVYAVAFWNNHGPVAQPLRAIRSQIQPNARDKSSDAYRKTENANLLFTIQHSWPVGYGFGKEFLRPIPMLDLRKVDPYLFVLPHNSILWVCMRMGVFGFLLFWALNYRWVSQAFRTTTQGDDPISMRWAILGIITVFLNLAIAYFDMGMYGARIQLYIGLVLGIVDRLSLLPRDPASDALRTNKDRPKLTRFRLTRSHTVGSPATITAADHLKVDARGYRTPI